MHTLSLFYREKILPFFSQKRTCLLFSFISVFIWGIVCHGYGIFDHAFNHDSLNAIFADTTENTLKLQVGRFLVPLYRILTRGPMAMPWLICVLGFCFISISVFLLSELYELKNSFVPVFFISGIVTTCISFTAQIASYVFEFDTNALSLLFAVAAVFFLRKIPGIKGILLAAISAFLSLGIYQSYIAVSFTLLIHLAILDLLSAQKPSAVVKKGLCSIVPFLCGGVLYFGVDKLVCAVANVASHSRTDIFSQSNGVNNIFSYYAGLLIKAYKQFYRSIVRGIPFHVIAVILVASAVVVAFVIISLFRKSKKLTLSHGILLACLGILIPLGSLFPIILSGGQFHDLMGPAVYFIYILFFVIILRYSEKKDKGLNLKNFTRVASYAIISVLLFQNTVIAGSVYLKKNLEADVTLSTMTRVMSRVEQLDGYVPGETPVAFIGNIDTQIPGFDRVTKIASCQYNDSIGIDGITPYYYTYKAYFEYIMNCPVNTCDSDTVNTLKRMSDV